MIVQAPSSTASASEVGAVREPRKGPARPSVRTCVGCSQEADKEDLVRIVLGPGGIEGGAEVAVDVAGSAFGRGAHVHPTRECLERAAKSGFSKSFKTKVRATADGLAEEIVRGVEARLEGLLLGARRGGHLAIGHDAAIEAMKEGASLLVVASDASTAGEFSEAVAAGKAVAFGTKVGFGRLFGRDEVAFVAVTNAKVAKAIGATRRMALAVGAARGSSDVCRSEVR